MITMQRKEWILLSVVLLLGIPVSHALFRGGIQRQRTLVGDIDSALEEGSILSNNVIGEQEEEKDEALDMVYDSKENEEEEEIMERLQDTPVMNMITYRGTEHDEETQFPSAEQQQLETVAPTEIVTFTDQDGELSNIDDEYEVTDTPTVVATTSAPSLAPAALKVVETGNPTVQPNFDPSTSSPTDGDTLAPTMGDTEGITHESWWNNQNDKDPIEHEKTKMSDSNSNQETSYWTQPPSATTPSWENPLGDHGIEEESSPTKHEQKQHQHESSSSSNDATTIRAPTNPIDILEQDAEEVLHDKNVRIVTPIFVVIALALMICVAQQMVENPDGCCARICRCSVDVCRFVASSCLCCCCMSSQQKARRTHDLIVTNGYDDYDHDLQLQ